MFTTNIKVRCRLHIMKSLLLLGGPILKENERQGRSSLEAAFKDLDKVFKNSLAKRVAHYIQDQEPAKEIETLATSEAPSLPGDVLELNVNKMKKTSIMEMRSKNAKKLDEVVKKAEHMQI